MDEFDKDLMKQLVDNLSRVVRVEGALAEHTRAEELFQTRVADSLESIDTTVKALAAEHDAFKGVVKGVLFVFSLVAVAFSDVGRAVVSFLHGVVK